MFYEPGQKDPPTVKNAFMSVVVPRPIGWVSTVNKDGKVNLAPYSFYAPVDDDPPIIAISSQVDAEGGRKETERNIMESGECVVNVVTWDLHNDMMTSAKYKDQDAVAERDLEHVPSHTVKPPRVAKSPVQLECKLISYTDLPEPGDARHVRVMFMRVTGIHIDESVVTNGFVDLAKLDPVGATGRPLVRVKDGLPTDPKP